MVTEEYIEQKLFYHPIKSVYWKTFYLFYNDKNSFVQWFLENNPTNGSICNEFELESSKCHQSGKQEIYKNKIDNIILKIFEKNNSFLRIILRILRKTVTNFVRVEHVTEVTLEIDVLLFSLMPINIIYRGIEFCEEDSK